MGEKKGFLQDLKEKGLEALEQIGHLPREDLDRLKKKLTKTTLSFINKRRNPDKLNSEIIKKLHRKRWLKPLLEFPYQEVENSTIVVMGVNDYHSLLGLGLNTTFFLALDGGGIMSYPGCPLIKSELPPRYKESFFLNEQLSKIIPHHPEIERIFLISSFPLSESINQDPFWNIKFVTIWLAEAQEYLLHVIKKIEVFPFLIYNDRLYQVMTEKVLIEKNEGKIGL